MDSQLRYLSWSKFTSPTSLTNGISDFTRNNLYLLNFVFEKRNLVSVRNLDGNVVLSLAMVLTLDEKEKEKPFDADFRPRFFKGYLERVRLHAKPSTLGLADLDFVHPAIASQARGAMIRPPTSMGRHCQLARERDWQVRLRGDT